MRVIPNIWRKKIRPLGLMLLVLTVVANVLFCSLPLFANPEEEQIIPEPEVFGDYYLLMYEDTDQVLLEHNANERVYPASTTKIMTAIIVLENVSNLDEIVNVDSESPFVGGSVIYIDVNEKISVRNLLHALLIASGNDAASALAVHVAGSTEKFAEMMNTKAKELGCTGTNFVNPHGLHDPNHYTTLMDLYLIAKEAMKNDVFRSIVSKGTYDIPPTNKQTETRHLYSTNALIDGGTGCNDLIVDLYGNNVTACYPYALGIKTGYTDEAGKCLVSAAKAGDSTVYSIVMHSDLEHVFQDSARLLEYGLFGFKQYEVLPKDELVKSVDLGDESHNILKLVTDMPLTAMLKSEPNPEEVKLKVTTDEFSLPIKAGVKLGMVEAFYGTRSIGKVSISSSVDITGKPLLDDQIFTEKRPIKINYKRWIIRVLSVFFLFVFITIFAYIIGVHPNSKRRR